MDTLPLDVLLDVLSRLPVHALLVLRRTSRSLHAVTHLRTLWTLLFRTHVLDQHIPFPTTDTPLPDLSARELESLTRRALALRRRWTSPRPVPRRQVTFDTPSEPAARVIFLQFLPGRSNRWLISVRMTAQPTSYLLQCWDVHTDQPTCVAELRHADGPYGGVVLNTDPSSPAVLAMQSAQTETFSVHFDAQDPECGFVTEATIDGIRELHLLCGSTLVTRRPNDGALSLWDLADLQQEKLQLLSPSLVQPDDRVQAIHIAHDYAIVVRIQSVEIYSTVPRPSLLSPHATPVAYPLGQFKFQWRTDTVVLCAQHAQAHAFAPWTPPPIHLLVRFGSTYPWPVNVLHHYRLLPNPTYHVRGVRRQTPISASSSRSTTPSTSSPCPCAPARPVTTEYNLPYDPCPSLTHTIGSPVRLFGQSGMALGRYGTALWLDNHTEEWLGPSERGQRLAGKVIGVGIEEGEGASEGDEDQGTTSGASANGVVTAAPTETPATEPSAAYASTASMLFGVHDDDAWTRVTMEEQAGRIALGHVDGAITLMEY